MADSSLSKREQIRVAFLLLGACLLSYANGLTGAFTYDDKAIIRDNPKIRSPRVVSQIFRTNYFGRPRGSGANYRPILLASFAAQWWIHGGKAAAFRAVNVLLHAAATLLLARLFFSVGFPFPQAAGGGLLFAVHPIHVESVTSLVGRGETLAAIFVLLFLLLALRAAACSFFSWWRYLLALLCYFLGALTKESAAVAPALLFLFLFRMEEGGAFKRLRGALRRGVPLYAASAAALCGVFLLRSWVLGGYLGGAQTSIFELENPLAPLPPLERVVNACVILFRYLGRTIFPLLLSADESAWSIPLVPAASLLGLGAAILLLLLLFVAFFAIGTAPAAAFGTLFFGVAILPTANLLFPIGTVFAERLAYLPSAGVCLLLAAGILGNSPRLEETSRGRLTLFFCLTLLFAGRTVVRNTVWQSDLLLFSNTVSTSPGSAKSHYNLAYALAEAGDHRGALARYVRATRIYPPYFDAWAGKGRMERELGHLADAEASYLRSLAARSAYANGFFGLGVVREARGNWQGAEAAYAEGLRKNPGSLPLALRLALARSRLAPRAAEKDWRHALSIGPGSAPVRLGYARWLLSRGRKEEARGQVREVLRRSPASLEALRFLADRNAEEGLRFAEGLARERIFRISRSREDLIPLLRLVAEGPVYGERYNRLRATLQKLAPQAFAGVETP